MSSSISAQSAIFLDFDGTLVEFAPHPDAVAVTPDLRQLLHRLWQVHEGALAIISGRSLVSLDNLLRLPELPLAGGHGAEWRMPDGTQHKVALESAAFTAAVERLTAFALPRKLLLENKRHSVALHFRGRPEMQVEVDKFIADEIASLQGLRTIYGNQVREVQPIGVDKGVAVARFMAVPPFIGRLPCYFGDDTTDEDAFRWINEHGGRSYKIGSGDTCADNRLASVADVRQFLTKLLAGNVGEQTSAE